MESITDPNHFVIVRELGFASNPTNVGIMTGKAANHCGFSASPLAENRIPDMGSENPINTTYAKFQALCTSLPAAGLYGRPTKFHEFPKTC